MKTHVAAGILRDILSALGSPLQSLSHTSSEDLIELIELLKHAPNIELADARIMKKTDEIAVSIKALVSLSKYDKNQWVSIVREFGLPIELNPRASTRDVVGKVLSYLDTHPEVLKQRRRVANVERRRTTPGNLEDTLNKLINFK